MKAKIFITLFVIFSISATTAFAKIWTVDNNIGGTGDFTTLQAAHDGASDGDTLHVTGSPTNYGDLTLIKKLYLYGTGYFLGENPNTQAKSVSSIIEQVVFKSGSEGSVISGFIITNDSYAVYIDTNNITIKRNFLSYSIRITSGIINVKICQNYMGGNTSSTISIDIGANCDNITILSNFIYNSNGIAISSHSTSKIVIRHNVNYGSCIGVIYDYALKNIYNSIIDLNIIIYGKFDGSQNYVHIIYQI